MASPKLTSMIKRECLFTISPHRQCFSGIARSLQTQIALGSRRHLEPPRLTRGPKAETTRAHYCFWAQPGNIERKTFHTGEDRGRAPRVRSRASDSQSHLFDVSI